MSRAIGEACKLAEINDRLVPGGNYPSYLDSAAFAATIEKERASFGEIIKKADIKL